MKPWPSSSNWLWSGLSHKTVAALLCDSYLSRDQEAVEVRVLEMVPSAAVMCRGIMLDQ